MEPGTQTATVSLADTCVCSARGVPEKASKTDQQFAEEKLGLVRLVLKTLDVGSCRYGILFLVLGERRKERLNRPAVRSRWRRVPNRIHFSLLLLSRYVHGQFREGIACWLFFDQNSPLSFKFDIEKKGSSWIYAENRGTSHPDPMRGLSTTAARSFPGAIPRRQFSARLQGRRARCLSRVYHSARRKEHTSFHGSFGLGVPLPDPRGRPASDLNYALPGDFVGCKPRSPIRCRMASRH
jgi:hypothetical protein